MDVTIREQTLPGIGRRYDVKVGHRRRLSVIVSRTGLRELSISDDDADDPTAVVSLSQAQALAVAALLSGARFSLEPDAHPTAPKWVTMDQDVVTVSTVPLTDSSPAIGHSLSEIELPPAATPPCSSLSATRRLSWSKTQRGCRAGQATAWSSPPAQPGPTA